MAYSLSKKIYFVSEQDGDIEREFKDNIVNMLRRLKKTTRVYLVQIRYDESVSALNVAICYKFDDVNFNEEILNETASIFKSFGSCEHLDIIFLDLVQEKMLRKVCCPFFTSLMFQVQQPDFYLTSKEGYVSEKPIACFKRKKLIGINSSWYLLCDIKPEITGQKYGLGSKKINQVIFVCRHSDSTLFPVAKWPVSVYVIRPLIDKIDNINYICKSDIELMYWGSLYENKKDIE
jgi:hypothetical protein